MYIVMPLSRSLHTLLNSIPPKVHYDKDVYKDVGKEIITPDCGYTPTSTLSRATVCNGSVPELQSLKRSEIPDSIQTHV